MKTLIALASLTMLIGAGCGDDTTTATGADMTASADLTVTTPHDMATLTCAQVLMCAAGCTTQSCQIGCVTNGSSAAKVKFGTFGACLAAVCGTGDGGSGMCTSLTDTSTTCAQCLGAAAQAAATGTASTRCHTEYADCASN